MPSSPEPRADTENDADLTDLSSDEQPPQDADANAAAAAAGFLGESAQDAR